MHEGTCEQEVKSQGLYAKGFDALHLQARLHFDNKTRQISLDHDYNMNFLIAPLESECQYSPLKIQIWCSKQETFRMLLPLLRHVIGRTCHQPRFPGWEWLPRVIGVTSLRPQFDWATPNWAVINAIIPLYCSRQPLVAPLIKCSDLQLGQP